MQNIDVSSQKQRLLLALQQQTLCYSTNGLKSGRPSRMEEIKTFKNSGVVSGDKIVHLVAATSQGRESVGIQEAD